MTLPPAEQPVRIIERHYYHGYQEQKPESAQPVVTPQVTEPLPVVSPALTIVMQPPERIEQTIYVPTLPQGTNKEVERTGTAEKPEQKSLVPPIEKRSDEEQKTFTEPNEKRSETVPPNDKNNSPTIPNNSPSELFEPPEPTPQADIPALEKIKPGRQRRYETLGENGIESVREVVLFMHQFNRPWPGLSKDMETYYEHFYFAKPKRGEKEYDRHVKCWERRTRWITASDQT